jgi:hypothetical protein
MNNTTRLIVVVALGVAAVLVAALLTYQPALVPQSRGPIVVRIEAAIPAEPWLTFEAQKFSGREYDNIAGERRQINVEIIPKDGITALAQWGNCNYTRPATAWVAEHRDLVNLASAAAASCAGQDIFLTGGLYRDQPVATSPEVWVAFKSRADSLRAKYGRDIDWQMINQAATTPRGWQDLGGQPEWGAFKLVIPHPRRDPAGIAALINAAGGYYRRPAISSEDLQNPEFRRWLRANLDTVVDFAPFGAENMLLYGPSAGDVGQIVESYLLTNMGDLKKRWGREGDDVVVVYPDPIAWYDFPFAIYMGKEQETSAAEKDAALAFKQFLLGADAQRDALRFGLRPASPDIPADAEGSLIKQWESAGFLVRVPASSKMRQPSRSAMQALIEWFVAEYER